MTGLGELDPAWSSIERVDTTVRGRRVHLLHHPAAGAGTPQLLVHGLGGASLNWLDVIPLLAAHGEVVAVDLPGFGRTPVPRGGSARVRANAGFIRALLDELGWQRVVLHGGSMGGLIAILVAARDTRVERLVLVNPAVPAAARDRLRQPPGVFARILPAAAPGIGRAALVIGTRVRTAEELVDGSIAAVFADVERLRPPMRAVMTENTERLRTQPWRRVAIVEAAASTVAAVASGRELVAAIDAIAVPTLLTWSDGDRLVAERAIAATVARRPDWHHHRFAGVGHTPMVEVPDEYAAVVTRFYGETTRARGDT